MASSDLTLDSIGKLIAREFARSVDDVPAGEFCRLDLARKLNRSDCAAGVALLKLIKSGAVIATKSYRIKCGKKIRAIQHYRRVR